jgi:hypothetical protein
MFESEFQGRGVRVELPAASSNRVLDFWVGDERVQVHPELLPLQSVGNDTAAPASSNNLKCIGLAQNSQVRPAVY